MSAFAQPFRFAVVSIAAVLASFGVVYAMGRMLGVNASPAILAATLAMSLSRRAEIPTPRKLAVEFLMLPLIALTAGLVGAVLRSLPPLGAALFIGGIVLSILLRRYGETARTVGRVLAIPLICILVVPVHMDGVSTRWMSAAVVIAAGLAALLCSAAAAWIGARIGWIEAKPESEAGSRLERTPSTSPLHISTRMALQMLVALGLAFAIGMTVFPAHWAWVVLTAFIVCSGTVSRGDAIYKGLMRLGGAVGGASLAAAIAHIAVSDPVYDAAIIFIVLFVGIWLRPINYAWWAVCATLIFALLQGPQDEAILPLLGIRVVCILLGALCGVAAAWFVYPIRTEQLVRKRVAEALHVLRDALASGQAPDMSELDRHSAELDRLAPPLRLHHRLVGSANALMHPCAWIDRMQALIAQARKVDLDRSRLRTQMRELGAMLKARTPGPANQNQATANVAD
ncbi:MAG: FUSC family protein [Deltaproteobacteria bacterium]